MTIRVREGGAADDARCGEIIAAAAGGSVYAARLPHARAVFEDNAPLSQGERLRLVAERDGRAVGFADFRPDGHIRYLFVDPGAQGCGAGAALVDEVQRRCGAIAVHCLALNDAGLAWYLRRGFRIDHGWCEDFHSREAVWLHLERAALP